MAIHKKTTAHSGEATWGKMSWREFFFASSVVLNIAFAIVFGVMVWTNQADSTIINEGLTRYCDVKNDSKFDDSNEEVQALRNFTCARGDAKQPFNNALDNYLLTKGIQRNAE